MKKMIVFLVILGLIPPIVNADSSQTYWFKSYKGFGYNEVSTDVIAMGNGDILVVGYDIYLLKNFIMRLSSKGEIRWARTYKGPNIKASTLASNNDIVLVGESCNVIRLDPHGNVRWWKSYRGRSCGVKPLQLLLLQMETSL